MLLTLELDNKMDLVQHSSISKQKSFYFSQLTKDLLKQTRTPSFSHISSVNSVDRLQNSLRNKVYTVFRCGFLKNKDHTKEPFPNNTTPDLVHSENNLNSDKSNNIEEILKQATKAVEKFEKSIDERWL